MSTSRKTFTAQFDGHCMLCGEEVLAGEEAAYVDDDFSCDPCWEAVVTAEQEGRI